MKAIFLFVLFLLPAFAGDYPVECRKVPMRGIPTGNNNYPQSAGRDCQNPIQAQQVIIIEETGSATIERVPASAPVRVQPRTIQEEGYDYGSED